MSIVSKVSSHKGTVGGSTIATIETGTKTLAVATTKNSVTFPSTENDITSSSSIKNKSGTKPSNEDGEEKLDYVAEYDFFANIRKQHLEEMTRQKRIDDAKRRSKQREEQLKWRDDGKERYQLLEKKVIDIRFILRPHQLFREAMNLLIDYSDQAWELRKREPFHPVHKYFSTTLLKVILQNPPTIVSLTEGNTNQTDNSDNNASSSNNDIEDGGKDESKTSSTEQPKKKKTLRFGMKTNLIEWKMVIMRQLRCRFRYPWHRDDQGHPFQDHPHELKIIRILFRIFMNYIPISFETRETLRKLRYKHNRAVHKLNLIHKTKLACEYIGECTSLQHFNPKGCANCGVIYVGGSLEGAVPYVKSVSRDTGVSTLVTLEFEIETLLKEEEIQVVVVDEVTEELTKFENEVVFIKVRSSIQQWWCLVLQFKRLRRILKQVQRSLFYYRVRRLSKMKKEIDTLIIEAHPIDMIYCCDKYCDYLKELLEYVLLQQEKKDARMGRIMLYFHRRLVEIVEEARERRHRELMRLLAIPKPDPPIKIKSLRPVSPKRLVCYREECAMRSFLTKDRLEIHMKIHYEDDKIRFEKIRRAKAQKLVKDKEEKFMIENINKSKEYLQEYLNETAQSEEGFGSTLNNDVSSMGFSSSPRQDNTTMFCQPVGMRTPLFSATITSKSNSPMKGTMPPKAPPKSEDDIAFVNASKLSWSALPHRYNMYGLFNGASFTLELVSKHSSIEASSKVTIESAVTRVGTHESCELPIKLSGELERLGKIGKIHCLIYHGVASIGHENDDDERHEQRKKGLETLTIVDNSSVYGCYIVGKDGAIKVPNKVSKGLTIYNGNLVCIGVMKDGPPVLPITEASLACIVYRLQIHAK